MTNEATLLNELPWLVAERSPQSVALRDDTASVSYAELSDDVRRFAGALSALGLARQERVAIYLDKRRETVIASFGAPAQGAVFVPINPLLKAEQVAHILRDSGVRILVTSKERLKTLKTSLHGCTQLSHVILAGDDTDLSGLGGIPVHSWTAILGAGALHRHRVIDTDIAAILYTSGSTGKPKGVVLSHRNMVAGAKSVASYLDNRAGDVLLAALPLSFDAGFSQLTTAFHTGASVVLLNYLLPKDVVKAVVAHRVRALSLFREYRWPHAAQHTHEPAYAAASRQAVSDVRPDRGLSGHLPATRRSRPQARFDRQVHTQ